MTGVSSSESELEVSLLITILDFFFLDFLTATGASSDACASFLGLATSFSSSSVSGTIFLGSGFSGRPLAERSSSGASGSATGSGESGGGSSGGGANFSALISFLRTKASSLAFANFAFASSDNVRFTEYRPVLL